MNNISIEDIELNGVNAFMPTTEPSVSAKATTLAILATTMALCAFADGFPNIIKDELPEIIFQYDTSSYISNNPNYIILTTQRIINIEELYTFKDKRVNIFLEKHENIVPTLHDIFKRTQEVFGIHIKNIDLEFIKDSEEGFEGLAVIIKTNLTPTVSLDFLEKFDEEWLNVDWEVRSLLTVMTRSYVL